MQSSQLHEPAVHVPETQAEPDGVERMGIRDRIRAGVRGRVDRLLGKLSPLASPFVRVAEITTGIGQKIGKVMDYFRSSKSSPEAAPLEPVSSELPIADITGEPTPTEAYPEKPQEVAQAYQVADQLEQEEADKMAYRFVELQNNYRRQLKHDHDDLQMGSIVLSRDPEFTRLAEQIAERQASQGVCEHSSEEDRQLYGIEGENLISDFSTPEEALRKFITSKKNHYEHLAGSYQQVACAVRYGVEKATGKKRAFMAVLFRGGGPQSHKPPVSALPQEPEKPVVTGTSVQECVADRPVLKAAFQALDKELEQHPGVSYELNQEVTQKMQEKESLRGQFCITLRQGDRQQLYTVADHPAVAQRSELVGDQGKVFQIAFADLLQDFENMTTVTIPADSPTPPPLSDESQQNSTALS